MRKHRVKRGFWDDSKIEYLKQEINNGKNLQELSIILGVSYGAIRRICFQKGLKSQKYFLPSKQESRKTDELIIELFNQKLSPKEIASQLNLDESCISRRFYKLGLRTERGKWVREQVELKKQGFKKCSSCHETFKLEEFLKGSKNSCKCFECRSQSQKARYKTYEQKIGILKYALRRKLNGAKSRAKKKKMEFSITLQDLIGIYDKQNGKCYYTGEEMISTEKGSCFTANNHKSKTISLDRKNPLIGYTKENTVLCCFYINTIKNSMFFDDFIDVCTKIGKKFMST